MLHRGLIPKGLGTLLDRENEDDEVRKIVLGCSDKACEILNENIDMLHKTSKILLEREVLDAEELEMIVKGEELPPISKQELNAMRSIKIETSEPKGKTFGEEPSLSGSV